MKMNEFKIIVIIQRSNGDVFLSLPLIEKIYNFYKKKNVKIDLLINDDTFGIAKTIPYINNIYKYSYSWKKLDFFNKIKNEFNLISTIYKKYDLSINLTASDRSVLYSKLSGKMSISAIEEDNKKSWWKKFFLTKYYIFNPLNHIILNNLEPLNLLNIPLENIHVNSFVDSQARLNILNKLNMLNIKSFIIFHPSAQYHYKIYPEKLRNKLLSNLNSLNIPILVTGAKSKVDMEIKKTLPEFKNLFDFIGETNLEEYIALSELSLAYIGMDTLNMHIAASQNKKIFAIFGPTILRTWSPWSNITQKSASINKPKQTYDNITIFQADMDCVACGKAGCDDKHGKSECLYNISPQLIFEEVKNCLIK